MSSKITIAISVIICMTLLGFIGYRLIPFTKTTKQSAIQPNESKEMGKPDFERRRTIQNTTAVHRCTKPIQTKKNTASGDVEDQAARNKVDFWETLILDYAKSFLARKVDANDVHGLAKKTADLFQMLQTASARREKGMEPYTGHSGFATMTLVMAMDKAYHEVLGVTFSDFMGTLDASLVKKMVNPEKPL